MTRLLSWSEPGKTGSIVNEGQLRASVVQYIRQADGTKRYRFSEALDGYALDAAPRTSLEDAKDDAEMGLYLRVIEILPHLKKYMEDYERAYPGARQRAARKLRARTVAGSSAVGRVRT